MEVDLYACFPFSQCAYRSRVMLVPYRVSNLPTAGKVDGLAVEVPSYKTNKTRSDQNKRTPGDVFYMVGVSRLHLKHYQDSLAVMGFFPGNIWVIITARPYKIPIQPAGLLSSQLSLHSSRCRRLT